MSLSVYFFKKVNRNNYLFYHSPFSQQNLKIQNIDKINLSEKDFIFHAGTKIVNNVLRSNGGRVLNFVVISDNFSEAKSKILLNLNKLNWQGGFYRKDIGYKVID